MELNIWCILDGKRGHEKQIEDLVFFINKKIKTNITKIKKIGFLDTILNFLRIRNDTCKYFPLPDLIIAAGHQTHLDALQKKYKYGGKVILLMKPTLPTILFDLIIAPLHDKFFYQKNIYLTNGPLNKIINKKKQKKNKGLILIGGPSKNFDWSSRKIEDEILQIIKNNRQLKLTLGTSRRTPDHFISKLYGEVSKHVDIKMHNNVSSNWLEMEVEKSEFSWVTQDSISMLYDLLNSGSKVTCISLIPKNKKFIKLYENLYLNKRINMTNKKFQTLEIYNTYKSTAELSAEYILDKFIH
jgi:mitochondrial fission protein ELM1